MFLIKKNLFTLLLLFFIGKLFSQEKVAPFINTHLARGSELRVLRLAIAVTGEYTSSMKGNTNEEKIQEVLKMTRASIASINEAFGREYCVRLELLPEEQLRKIIFTDPATDPWPDMSGAGCQGADKIHRVQGRVIDSIIGIENYDFSHVILGPYNGGCAGAFKVGYTGGMNEMGTVMRHEMGHQFNAGHSCRYEPKDNGKTMMCCDCEPYAHSDTYYGAANTLLTRQKNAGRNIPTGNTVPTVDAGPDKAIPIGTPFKLIALAKDPDAEDKLTYVWDQLDIGEGMPLPRENDTTGPLFSRYIPSKPAFRFFPRLEKIIDNVFAYGEEQLPTKPRELNFRLMVNDNHKIKLNGELVNASGINSDDIKLTVVDNGGAFKVTSQNNGESFVGGETINISWNVAGTNLAPINTENVMISLSFDGGKTFPQILLKSVPNNGKAKVLLPNIDTKNARIKVEAIDNYFFSLNMKDFIISQNENIPGIRVNNNTTLSTSENNYVSNYTIGLLKKPNGAVKVRVETSNQAILSLDGKNYQPTIDIVFTDTVSTRIFVKGKSDKEIEGYHFDIALHKVIASEDTEKYPIDMLAKPVTIRISDEQIPPIIGFAFTTEKSENYPKEWIKISDLKNNSFQNLSYEDGYPSTISLTTKTKSCGIGGCSFAVGIYGDRPLHTIPLSLVHGVAIAKDTTTFTWSGLEPNRKYRIFVMGYNPYGELKQTVYITGGAEKPIIFNQDLPRGVLTINDKISTTEPLVNFAKEVVAKSDGTIQILLFSISGKDETSITGLGICK
ncbi:MAG: reprolysin-like metallopeptidase [Chitinophagaceae bacterium]